METISVAKLLDSDLITTEESYDLIERYVLNPQITAAEILEIDLPAKNRVEALLQHEFLTEEHLRELACDFAEHTLPIYEYHAPEDRRPRRCVEAARLYFAGGATSEQLEAAIRDARPSMWRFQASRCESAFAASYAVLWLSYEDAAEMARSVAQYAQRAAHHKARECRKNNVTPLLHREKEASWQLARIVKKI